MADLTPSFLISWWYSPNTKLAIQFNTLTANLASTNPLGILNSTNGLSASVEENYRYENLITNQPVESGTNISDHIIVQPQVISITGLLTAIQTIPIIGTGVLNFNQLGSAIQFLDKAAKSRTLFTLTTGLYFGRSYFRAPSVAIQSIDIPRNNQFGRTSIKFTIIFKEVVVTDTNAVTSTNFSTQGSKDPTATGVT